MLGIDKANRIKFNSLMSTNSQEQVSCKPVSCKALQVKAELLYPATASKSSALLKDILSKYNGKDIASMPTVIEQVT